MRWIIASDIHGSAYYCRKLLEQYDKERADRLLLLGDILYFGPRNRMPKEYDPQTVIAMLNERKNDILCVRGNCDAEVDQMVLNFPILADYAVFSVGKRMIFATHGHHFNKDALPPLHRGDILLCGHTHVPACEEYENFVYLNPGSTTMPKENSAHSYMIWEGNLMQWKTIEGEVYREYHI